MYVKGRYKNDDGERQIRVSEKKSFKKRWKQQRLCSIATAVSQKKENNRVSNGEKRFNKEIRKSEIKLVGESVALILMEKEAQF